MQLTSFPPGNGALRNAGKQPKLALGLLEYVSSDVGDCFHGNRINIRFRIYKQVRYALQNAIVSSHGPQMKNIAEEIKRIRKAMEWNQAEFADAIGASQGSVSKWERGLEAPRTDALLRIRNLYQIEETNTEGAVFDFDKTPVMVDIPLTGAFLAPSEEDLYAGDIKSLGMLRLPRPYGITGPIIGWGIPRLEVYSALDYKPGQIIFSHRDTIDKPQQGDKVILRNTIQNRYLYTVRYYGSSPEKGFEWFTGRPATSGEVPLDSAIPMGRREEHGIFPVGIIFAAYGYDSPRRRFWDQIWDEAVNNYSEPNF